VLAQLHVAMGRVMELLGMEPCAPPGAPEGLAGEGAAFDQLMQVRTRWGVLWCGVLVPGGVSVCVGARDAELKTCIAP
jgi:hypothetical protein